MSDTEHSQNPDLPTDEEPKLRVVDKRWSAKASKADDSTGSSEENGNDSKKKQPTVIEKLEFEIATKDALIADYAKNIKTRRSTLKKRVLASHGNSKKTLTEKSEASLYRFWKLLTI